MVTTDELTIWTKMAILLSSDQEFLRVKRNQLSLVFSPKDFQFGLQQRSGTPLIYFVEVQVEVNERLKSQNNCPLPQAPTNKITMSFLQSTNVFTAGL